MTTTIQQIVKDAVLGQQITVPSSIGPSVVGICLDIEWIFSEDEPTKILFVLLKPNNTETTILIYEDEPFRILSV